MKKITFSFAIRSSHAATEPDYSGSAVTEIETGNFFENSECFGYYIETASVVKSDTGHIATVEFSQEIGLEDAEYFVQSFASFLTYHLSLNWSHAYGSPYVDVDYGEFYRDNGVGLRDHLNLNITRKFPLDRLPASAFEIHELVHFYFLGMQSNNVRAKFFNLFLILESIENSQLALAMYAAGSLFSDAEAEAIKQLASEMSPRPASMLRGVLRHTEEPRHAKLNAALHKLGVATFRVFDNSDPTNVTPELIRGISNARNKLFHKGNTFDETLLWGTLVPLARGIISVLLRRPRALDGGQG
ncbi:UNVERIFIED_ORG: hypothetical protein J2Y81_007799 [Paraburkholderia sediminicola]|nr:hypothetical protein [Paraburkholderia sediminicola]